LNSRKKIQPPVYPFTAIVGQEEMKLALLLNVIDASIGGVLIMGHRGTGKSTAVRALADLLPKIERVRGCFYNCDAADEAGLCDDCDARLSSVGKLARERATVPVAELPLGATEDRVCGSINIERALSEGVKTFEPGLLARANRGFLYIDEVNLLDDHLIDLLLDVAVTGRNLVEREGMSVEHPARFVLIGSGNPEEGALRPQLLDRFGLHVEVRTTGDVLERVRVVERRDAFDRDPEAFRANAASEQESLRRRITRARARLRQVELPREVLERIAELCARLKVDGHRGELTIVRAARALAVLEGRKVVSADDVRRVATMALSHRLRRDPLEQTGSGAALQQQLDNLFPRAGDDEPQAGHSTGEDKPGPSAGGNGSGGGKRPEPREEFSKSDEPTRDIPPALHAPSPEISIDSNTGMERARTTRAHSSRRREHARRSCDDTRRGRYARAVQAKTPGAKIALDATLRAAAQEARRGDAETWGRGDKSSFAASPRPRVSVSHSLRYKRFNRRAGTLFIFAVDASGSMALNRIAQAKGALAQLLRQSYVRRDRVAVVSFRGQRAEVLLRPSGSAARARGVLDGLGVGGATPLAAGLMGALEIARHERRRDAGQRIVLLLFTDGRANVSLSQGESLDRASRRLVIDRELTGAGSALSSANVTTVVVDTQNRFTSTGEAQKLAQLIGGHHVHLPPATAPGGQFAALVRTGL
jgi:magnesium chelatase subunit D